MKNYTVVIPTTDYLVGISDIVIEDPLVSGVICENNNLEALPISNKYSSFVRSPTGIIEKITGKPSYRIDITKKIEQGISWQLSIAIAHILNHLNFLDFSKDKELSPAKDTTIIWASGVINSNYDVKYIGHLREKFKKSISYFKSYMEMNISIHIVLSCENEDEFEQIINENYFFKQAIKEHKIKCFFIKNLEEYFYDLNIKKIFKKNKPSVSSLLKIKKYSKVIMIFCLISMISLPSYYLYQNINPLINLKKKNNYRDLLTSLNSYRQGDFIERISALFFDYSQNLVSKKLEDQIILNFIPFSNDKNFKNKCDIIDRTYKPICKLNIEATNIGKTEVFLWMLNFKNESYPNLKFEKQSKTDPKVINGMISSQETILINLNENNKPLLLFFVYGQKFDQNIRKWLNNLNKRKSLLETTKRRLKSLGFAIIIKKIDNYRIIQDIN